VIPTSPPPRTMIHGREALRHLQTTRSVPAQPTRDRGSSGAFSRRPPRTPRATRGRARPDAPSTPSRLQTKNSASQPYRPASTPSQRPRFAVAEGEVVASGRGPDNPGQEFRPCRGSPGEIADRARCPPRSWGMRPSRRASSPGRPRPLSQVGTRPRVRVSLRHL